MKALLHIFSFAWLLLSVLYTGAQPAKEIDSLKTVLREWEPQDSAYYHNLVHISTQFLFLHNLDSAAYYVGQAWKGLSQNEFPFLRAYALNRMGIIAGEKGDFPKSIEHFEDALSIGERLKNQELAKKIYSDFGRTYLNMEAWDKALALFFKALELAEEQEDLEGKHIYLHNISVAYSFLEQPKRALEFKRKSLDLPGYKLPPIRSIPVYMGLSSVFKELGQHDSSAIYAEKALHVAREIQHVPFQIRIYSALATNATDQESYSQALAYLNAQEELLNPKDLSMLNIHYNDKAYALFGLKRFEEAFNFAEKGLATAKELGQHGYLNNAYLQLYTFHKESNNTSEALKFRELLRTVEDSLALNEKQQELEKLEIQYASRQKEKELRRLKEATEKQEKLLKNQRLGLIISGVVLLLLGAATFIFFRNRMLKEKLQRSLTEQRLLRAQMNPYFLFHSLSMLQQFIVKGGDKALSLKYLSQFAQLMRKILESSRTEFIPLEEEIETLENYIVLQQLRHNFSFDYQIDIDQAIDKESWGIPSMLLQPVVENAIENRLVSQESCGKLSLDFFRSNGHLEITIEDNGNQKKQAHTQPGSTSQATATQLVQDRLKLLNKSLAQKVLMEIQELTGEHAGTRVTFRLPVMELA